MANRLASTVVTVMRLGGGKAYLQFLPIQAANHLMLSIILLVSDHAVNDGTVMICIAL